MSGGVHYDFYIAKKNSQNIGQLRRSDWCCENGYLKLEDHVNNNNNNAWGERVRKSPKVESPVICTAPQCTHRLKLVGVLLPTH